jgi:hypothetical protein
VANATAGATDLMRFKLETAAIQTHTLPNSHLLLSIHLSSVAKTTRVGAGDLAVSPYDNEATSATDVENNINKLSIYKFKTSW